MLTIAPEPDHTTTLVLTKLAGLEWRLTRGEFSGPPAQPAIVVEPGRVTLAFMPDDDPDLIGHIERLKLWLRRHALPLDFRAQWITQEAAATALASVREERARQDEKWGEQNNDPFTYLAVLTEEVGELAQAALHARFGGPAAAKLREEAVHTAAVALAIVECLDRGKWRWPE